MLCEIIMLTIIIYYTYYGLYTEPDAAYEYAETMHMKYYLDS